jgi:hypothetical protein
LLSWLIFWQSSTCSTRMKHKFSDKLCKICSHVTATCWKVQWSNPSGARFSAPVQTGSISQLACCTMGTGSFAGVKRSGTWRWPPAHI